MRPGAADYHLIVFHSDREWEVKIADAAIEKELLLLDPLFIAEAERRGFGLARGVVMASALVYWESLLCAWLCDEAVPVDGLPCNARQRIPLGKTTSWKINFHRGPNVAVGVKIDNRRLHPHQRQIGTAAFEALDCRRPINERG